MIFNFKKKRKICSRCKYGAVNFWFFNECWLTENHDIITTHFTAIREKHADERNKDGNCKSFERIKIKFLFWKF